MGTGDDAGLEDGDDVLTNGRTLSDDDSLDSSCDVKDDAISLITNANSTTSTRPKKRVQFLPDDFLVRVREIPPRSNKSSTGSDGSASESSDSEDSDTESATDSEDVSSERDTPSPALVESHHKFNTMPPLLYAAKGSYAISKQNSGANKSANNTVAKITGIHPSAIQISSSSNKNTPPKRTRRSPSPKLEKRTKKSAKNYNSSNSSSSDKVNNNKKTAPQNENSKTNKKRIPLKVKEGRISPPPPVSKHHNKSPSSSNSKQVVNGGAGKLVQRRGSASSASASKTLPVKKSTNSTVTTSLTVLNHSSSPSSESSLDRVSRTMQSLSMGKLYTVDGFIFPPHHAARDLHLPDLSSTSKSEDFHSSMSSPTQKRLSSVDLLSSPRRYNTHDVNNNNNNNNNYNAQPTPPQSANRKRRFYAWQMANGSIHNALHSTPNISQLWDSPGRSNSDYVDNKLFFSNIR